MNGAAAEVSEDGWIGWHNDSGFMTGLTPDIFVPRMRSSVEEAFVLSGG